MFNDDDNYIISHEELTDCSEIPQRSRHLVFHYIRKGGKLTIKGV